MKMSKACMKVLKNNKGSAFSVKEVYNLIDTNGYWFPIRGGKTPEFSCGSRLLRLCQTGKCSRIKYKGTYIYFV